MEGNGQDYYEANGVGPDVDGLVGGKEYGGEALDFGFRESIAVNDVSVHFPGVREVFVAD